MKCNLDCPTVFNGKQKCCIGCCKSRLDYMNESGLEEHWDSKNGFWKEGGCSLSRKDMPQECIDYDCKEYRHTSFSEYRDGEWVHYITSRGTHATS